MVKIVYNQPLVCASNNGFWSQFITPTRATRQRCCLSPGIFNIIIELLGLGIRQNKKIRGIDMNGEEIKAGQFADDLWTALVATHDNIDTVLQEIIKFGTFSGLQLNTEKSSVLRIGTFKDSDAKYYTMRKLFWSTGSIKILGINVHPQWEKMHKENYEDELNRVENILCTWKHRTLLPIDKITIINSLIHSLFTHKFMALLTPNKRFFQKYKQMIIEFIWNGKKSTIAYSKLIQDYSRLGLKLVDLESKNVALKAMWPVRWKNRDPKQINWFFHDLPIKNETCGIVILRKKT